MDEFRAALGQYLVGSMDVGDLEIAIDHALNSHADAGPQLVEMLDNLYQTGRLPHQIYAVLKRRIQKLEQQHDRAESNEADDRTRFQVPSQPPSGGSGSIPEDGRNDVPEDGRNDVPEDATRIAPVGPGQDPSSIPSHSDISSTGQSQQNSWSAVSGVNTGKTGQRTSQTGSSITGRGATGQTDRSRSQMSGTGRSSSGKWNHPSQWTGGGGGSTEKIELGSVIKDRYILEALLGQGGMGTVFKARDARKEEAQDRNPFVAVKILNDDFKRHPKALQALQRESRKAQDLAHPNILSVFDFDRDGDNVFMTMELLEGESLDKFNKRHLLRGIPIDRAFGIVGSLAAGLAYAHKKGIVHSDFKPANAFLTNSGTVKIFDFGIARSAKTQVDDGGEKTVFDAGELGALTPAYASCEMIEGGEPDQRDDIYALAIVAYELMAGKHPFEKKSAVNARNAGMTPDRIKGLNRRQWRAICDGLAFAREDRTPTVDEFVTALGPRGFPVALTAVAAVIVVVLGALALLIPGYLDNVKVSELTAKIQGGSDVEITGSLSELRELWDFERDLFRNIFSEGATLVKFVEYYSRRIDDVWHPSNGNYDYPQATALITELTNFFADSRSVGALQERIQNEKDTAIANLYIDLDRLREEGLLISGQGETHVVGVLSIIRQIDPEDPKLDDGAIPIRFAEVARVNLDVGLVELASRVVEQGLILTPGDVSLINMRDRVSNERGRIERDSRVTQLEQILNSELTSLVSLEALGSRSTEIRELTELDERNETLQRARAVIDQVLATEVGSLLESGSYAGGLRLIDDFSSLASERVISQQRSRIDAVSGEHRTRIADLFDRLDRAIREGRLAGDESETAGSLLEEISTVGVTQEQLDDAWAHTAVAFSARALKARDSEQWGRAREILQSGLDLNPPSEQAERLRGDLAALERFESIANESAEGRREVLLAEQKQREIQQFRDDFTSLIQSPVFSAANGREALRVLQTLNDYSSAPPDGIQQIANRFVARVDALKREQSWSDAILLADQALLILPQSPDIERMSRTLRADNQQNIAQTQQQLQTDVATRLDQLISEARLDETWNAELRNTIGEYAALVGEGSSELGDRNRRIAELYVANAKRLRLDERYENAKRQLERAQAYSSDTPSLAMEQEALERSQDALAASVRVQKQQAEIAGLKLNIAAKATAGDVSGAVQILEELRNKVSNDPFVSNEGPQLIGRAYVELASNEFAANRVNTAHRLLRKAESISPGLPETASLRTGIARGSLERLNREMTNDQPLNTSEWVEIVQEIRIGSPQVYTEKMPQIIRNVIAKLDDLARTDEAAAARKLTDSRAIFPESRELVSYAFAPADPCANPSLVGKGSGRRANCRDTLSDTKKGPVLVVIPSGGPFATPIAISKYEVTISDYNTYCELSGVCSARPGNRALPLTGISIQQAEGFVEWLGESSGANYRIPDGVEWEYAATAGGVQPSENFNCQVRQNGVLMKGQNLLPVNSGDPNGWGLKNYVGNAQEWVRSSNGWEVRGGAHTNNMNQCKIEASTRHTGGADAVTGFRVLREIG